MVTLLSEVKHLMEKWRVSKVPSKDNIYADMLKLLYDESLRLRHPLNKMHC